MSEAVQTRNTIFNAGLRQILHTVGENGIPDVRTL
jgi:hypothetical protein